MLRFDHIAVAGETLPAATAHVEASLDVTLQPGGQHPHFATHNTLLGLAGGLYLEAIAVDPSQPAPIYPRWFNLDAFSGAPRITNWILACDDLEAALDALGPGFGTPVALTRGDFKWRMAVPENGVLPFDGFAPALITWDCDTHPAERLTPSGLELTHLDVQHPQAAKMQNLLAPLLDDTRIGFATGPAQITANFAGPSGPSTLA